MQPERTTQIEHQTIMIVDDNIMNARLLSRQLESKGHHTEIILDPAMVEESIKQQTPALILLDIVMPGIDGKELLRRIRRAYNRIDLPIFMVSGKNQREEIANCLAAGANDFIGKPVNPKLLVAKISRQFQMKAIKADLERYQQKTAAALEAQSLSQISNSLSHEINNPLAIMIGRFKQVEKKLSMKDESSRRSAMQLFSSITHSKKRIQSLLEDLAIASSKQGEAFEGSCSLNLVIRNLHSIWQTIFEANSIKVSITLPPP